MDPSTVSVVKPSQLAGEAPHALDWLVQVVGVGAAQVGVPETVYVSVAALQVYVADPVFAFRVFATVLLTELLVAPVLPEQLLPPADQVFV